MDDLIESYPNNDVPGRLSPTNGSNLHQGKRVRYY